MRLALIAGIAAAVAGIGAGVGIGAAIWSGGGTSSSAPSRGFASPPARELKVTKAQATDYDDGFAVYSPTSDKLKWTPYYGASSCGTPKELKYTGYSLGGVGSEYKGSAEIEDSGSCYFRHTEVYWKDQFGGTFGLDHSHGAYSCLENCRLRDYAFIYTR
jgi:hypothetical protein